MNSTTETIRDKIRKLLRVVECDSASEAEKSAALYQASRLSQKHAIDLDALGGKPVISDLQNWPTSASDPHRGASP